MMKLIQSSALMFLFASWAFQGALSASNEYPGCSGKKGTSDCASSTRKTTATLATPVPSTDDNTDITGASPGTGNDVDDPTNGEDGKDSQLVDGHAPTLGKTNAKTEKNPPPKPENVGIEKGLAALGKGIENGLTAHGNALGKGHENGLTAVGNGIAAHGNALGKGHENGLAAHGKGHENGLTALGKGIGSGIAFCGLCAAWSAWLSRPPLI
jgi:hypothetical protein